MNKTVWKHKSASKGKLRSKKKFQKKVEQALESDLPLNRIVNQGVFNMVANTGLQAILSIPYMDIPELEQTMDIVTGKSYVAGTGAVGD